jgi:hypothetical protein
MTLERIEAWTGYMVKHKRAEAAAWQQASSHV